MSIEGLTTSGVASGAPATSAEAVPRPNSGIYQLASSDFAPIAAKLNELFATHPDMKLLGALQLWNADSTKVAPPSAESAGPAKVELADALKALMKTQAEASSNTPENLQGTVKGMAEKIRNFLPGATAKQAEELRSVLSEFGTDVKQLPGDSKEAGGKHSGAAGLAQGAEKSIEALIAKYTSDNQASAAAAAPKQSLGAALLTKLIDSALAGKDVPPKTIDAIYEAVKFISGVVDGKASPVLQTTTAGSMPESGAPGITIRIGGGSGGYHGAPVDSHPKAATSWLDSAAFMEYGLAKTLASGRYRKSGMETLAFFDRSAGGGKTLQNYANSTDANPDGNVFEDSKEAEA